MDDPTDSVMTTKVGFDPDIHLVSASVYDGLDIPRITMEELGFSETSLTKIGATHPFPLFTVEAIRRMREEIVDHDTLAKYMHSDDNSPCVIRGFAEDESSFTYQAWTHPEVSRRVNEFAGIDLELIFNYEIGHTNIQLGPRGWAGLKADPDLPSTQGTIAPAQEIQPTLYKEPNWHFDSYPYVCIVMLSDSIHIKGGQTVIRKADGSTTFIPLPPIGHACILLGGYLCHGISPTERTQERMSMVTSYRPTDPLKEDCSILRGVRSQSHVPTLYRDWSTYRLRVLAARAAKLAEELEKTKPVKESQVEGIMEQFVKEQTAYLLHTIKEMSGPMSHVPTDTKKAFLEWKKRQGVTTKVSA